MAETASPPGALHALTATQAAALIRTREVSPVELVQNLLDRTAEHDQHLRAWVRLDAERALAAARAAELSVTSDDAHRPLHGVPFGAKDIFDSAGLPTVASF